jgi:hypothetical protein
MKTDEKKVIHIIQFRQYTWNQDGTSDYEQDCDNETSFTNIIGKPFFGRAFFEERHAYVFSPIFKGNTADMTIERIHFLTPGVAIMDIHAKLENYVAPPLSVTP